MCHRCHEHIPRRARRAAAAVRARERARRRARRARGGGTCASGRGACGACGTPCGCAAHAAHARLGAAAGRAPRTRPARRLRAHAATSQGSCGCARCQRRSAPRPRGASAALAALTTVSWRTAFSRRHHCSRVGAQAYGACAMRTRRFPLSTCCGRPRLGARHRADRGTRRGQSSAHATWHSSARGAALCTGAKRRRARRAHPARRRAGWTRLAFCAKHHGGRGCARLCRHAACGAERRRSRVLQGARTTRATQPRKIPAAAQRRAARACRRECRRLRARADRAGGAGARRMARANELQARRAGRAAGRARRGAHTLCRCVCAARADVPRRLKRAGAAHTPLGRGQGTRGHALLQARQASAVPRQRTRRECTVRPARYTPRRAVRRLGHWSVDVRILGVAREAVPSAGGSRARSARACR